MGHKATIWEGTIFVLGGADDDGEVCGFRELPSFSLHEKRWYSSQTTPAGKEKEETEKCCEDQGCRLGLRRNGQGGEPGRHVEVQLGG